MRTKLATLMLMLMLLVGCDTTPPPSAPTAVALLPTATFAPLTAPPIPTTDTHPLPSATPLPPTDTPPLPTDTPPPPTVTPIPVTDTPRPPTDTPLSVLPTNTPLPTKPTAPPTHAPTVGGNILRGPKGKHEVAITFDAGGGSGNVPLILQALRERGIHITFFLTGKWVVDNPDAARAIAGDGHEISNHTYNHLHLPTVPTDTVVMSEISSAEQEIRDVTSLDPRPYFRFPYGEYDQRTLKIVHDLGYTSVLWTLDSLDSVGQPKSAEFLIKRVTEAKIDLDGAIILMHVGNETSAQALPTILDRLAAKGYRVVSIPELLR